jgi:two-component system, OmpR family, phosphate regulon sensor histidine kinase PhoR
VSSPSPVGWGHVVASVVIVSLALGGVVIAALKPGSTFAVLLLAVGAAVFLGIRQAFNHARLRELRRVAAAFAVGDVKPRADVAGVDSIATLASELNALGDRLTAAGAALETQRRMLDGALGSLAEGVACIDDLDRVLYANSAWRHLAAGGGDTPGGAFYEHLPAAALSAAVAHVRVSDRADEVEFEHRRRRLRATVSRATPEALVVVLHDLTELKRLEGARRGFVAAVSHELKTPLTAIAGFAETLLDGGLQEDPVMVRGFVEKIARHAERLTVLVRDVLTLSRLEQGAWEVHPVALDLSELGRQLAEEHQPAALAKQVRILVEAPDRLEAVTDRELLHQLLGNLVSNAVRYNRSGGTVTISMSQSADQLHLAVADTGIGIPAEHRERVFERFYRVDAHRSRASGGTGLGLSIVKQLVDALQGTIDLKSSGEGTTFTVDMPRTDPRAIHP